MPTPWAFSGTSPAGVARCFAQVERQVLELERILRGESSVGTSQCREVSKSVTWVQILQIRYGISLHQTSTGKDELDNATCIGNTEHIVQIKFAFDLGEENVWQGTLRAPRARQERGHH